MAHVPAASLLLSMALMTLTPSKWSHYFGALVLIEDRALIAFQFAHRTVAVERDYQRVSKPPRLLKVSYVPGVDQVETTIGENHTKP